MLGCIELKKTSGVHILLLGCLALIGGCAAQAKSVADVKIDSMPAGARISYYYEKANKKISKGVTPFRSTSKQSGNESTWLVAELSGYETEIFKLDSSPDNYLNHDLIFEEDFSLQIRKERSSYSREYRESIPGILKTCESVLSLQGMLAVSVISKANEEYQSIQSRYPDYKGSALDRAVKKLLEKIALITEVEYTNNLNSHLLIRNINALITKIYFGIRSY